MLSYANNSNNVKVVNQIKFILHMILVSPQVQQQLDNNIKNYKQQDYDVKKLNYNYSVSSYGLMNGSMCVCAAELQQLLQAAGFQNMSIQQLIYLLSYKDLCINQQAQTIYNLEFQLSNLNVDITVPPVNNIGNQSIVYPSNYIRKKRHNEFDIDDCSSDGVSYFSLSIPFNIQLFICAYV